MPNLNKISQNSRNNKELCSKRWKLKQKKKERKSKSSKRKEPLTITNSSLFNRLATTNGKMTLINE